MLQNVIGWSQQAGLNNNMKKLSHMNSSQTNRDENPKQEREKSVFQVIEVRDRKGPFKESIPIVPVPYAWICLSFNIFTPGIGTLLMAFAVLFGAKTSSTKTSRCGDFFLNFISSLLQMLTALLIIGWVWSIFWGMDIVLQATRVSEQKRRKKRSSQSENIICIIND